MYTNVHMHTPVTKTCIEQAGLARECQTSSTHMHTNRAHLMHTTLATTCASLFAARSGCTDQHWEELAPMSHTRCSMQAHTCGDNGSMQDKHPDVHTPMRLHKDQPACVNRLNHTSHTQCVQTAGQQHANTLCDMPIALQRHAPTRAARHVTCGPHPTSYLFITPPQLGHHTCNLYVSVLHSCSLAPLPASRRSRHAGSPPR